MGKGFRTEGSAKAPPSPLFYVLLPGDPAVHSTLQKVQCLQLQIPLTITRNYSTHPWVSSTVVKVLVEEDFAVKRSWVGGKCTKWGRQIHFFPSLLPSYTLSTKLSNEHSDTNPRVVPSASYLTSQLEHVLTDTPQILDPTPNNIHHKSAYTGLSERKVTLVLGKNQYVIGLSHSSCWFLLGRQEKQSILVQRRCKLVFTDEQTSLFHMYSYKYTSKQLNCSLNRKMIL